MKKILSSLSFLICCIALQAQTREPMLSMFKENYFVTGLPLNETPDYDTNDAAYQISIRFNAFQNVGGSKLDVFAGFTDMAIWDLYRPSNPFRSNTYMAGVYGWCPLSEKAGEIRSDLLFGLEHRSNGLDSYDSRDLNYAFATYTRSVGSWLDLQLTGRFGISSIANTVSLEMYDKYVGYLNAGAMLHNPGRSLLLSASVTPLFHGDIPCNVSAELAWRPFRRTDSFFLTARYHYGYDENQLDCARPGVFLKHMLRFGLSLQPSLASHKLFF